MGLKTSYANRFEIRILEWGKKKQNKYGMFRFNQEFMVFMNLLIIERIQGFPMGVFQHNMIKFNNFGKIHHIQGLTYGKFFAVYRYVGDI